LKLEKADAGNRPAQCPGLLLAYGHGVLVRLHLAALAIEHGDVFGIVRAILARFLSLKNCLRYRSRFLSLAVRNGHIRGKR